MKEINFLLLSMENLLLVMFIYILTVFLTSTYKISIIHTLLFRIQHIQISKDVILNRKFWFVWPNFYLDLQIQSTCNWVQNAWNI